MASKLADGPLVLLTTPFKVTGETDAFTSDASHMAVVHNVILRGYNSIYKQAPLIHKRDVRDFLGYCAAWVEMVFGHHQSEETVLFPMLAEGAGVPNLMDTDKSEHEAFYGGLDKFKQYLEECASAADPPAWFDSNRALTIMDGFGEALHSHLRDEPPRIAALKKYSAIDLGPIRKATEKDSMNRTSPVYLLPILWFNHDVDFEDQHWRDFPGLPFPVKWVMVNIIGWWRSNWWRFGSVDQNGKLVPLLALRDGY